MKWHYFTLIWFCIFFLGPVLALFSCSVRLDTNWQTASRESANLAPHPSKTHEAVVQVYAARAYNWRGIFAVHMWIAVKPQDEYYTNYQVVGWRAYRGGSAVVVHSDIPDRYWYGHKPEVLLEWRGERAAAVIPKIQAAVESYPYEREYTVWPGPNSNTFIAHVIREVPELELDLPVTAIGKDFTPLNQPFIRAPSGTGYQLSVFGVVGITVAREEGLELNFLGLAAGIDPLGPAIKLPGIGRIGWR